MSLDRVKAALKEKQITYTAVVEDGLESVDFEYRGLSYHIWEMSDDGEHVCGVETNLFHAGRTEEIEGDYEQILIDELNRDFN